MKFEYQNILPKETNFDLKSKYFENNIEYFIQLFNNYQQVEY